MEIPGWITVCVWVGHSEHGPGRDAIALGRPHLTLNPALIARGCSPKVAPRCPPVHEAAREQSLLRPTSLIVDSRTKNITQGENPELVGALYKCSYELASETAGRMQFILIDSYWVAPNSSFVTFAKRRMAIEDGSSPLFSTYRGP